MTINQGNYVIVNVWTSEKNKALVGTNVGHVSLETSQYYISLWPGERSEKLNRTPKLFAPLKRKLVVRPTKFMSTYITDCLLEAVHEKKYETIKDINACGPNQYPFTKKIDSEEREGDIIGPVDTTKPFMINQDEELVAVTPLNASARIVLYSLNIHELESKFLRLKDSVKGWRLIGSHAFSRLTVASTENCSSLAYRCLTAGGMYDNLGFERSCQTSIIVTPDDLLRHVIAAKEWELKNKDYAESANWIVPGMIETSLSEIKQAYQARGQNANPEEDFFPDIKPSNSSCLII